MEGNDRKTIWHFYRISSMSLSITPEPIAALMFFTLTYGPGQPILGGLRELFRS